MLVRWIALTLTMLLGVACAGDRPLDSLAEADALRTAPSNLVVDGVEIAFTAHVSRNYMPVSTEKGISLGVRLRRVPTPATSPFRAPLPAGVAIERVYVVHGDRVWAPTIEVSPDQPVGRLGASAREGPFWEPDEAVDVIARVTVPNGAPVYVAARGQRIGRSF